MDLNCGGCTFFGLLTKKAATIQRFHWTDHSFRYCPVDWLHETRAFRRYLLSTILSHSEAQQMHQMDALFSPERIERTRNIGIFCKIALSLLYIIYIPTIECNNRSFDKIRSNIQFSTSSNSVTSAILKFTIKEVAASRSALSFILDFLFS